MLELYENIRKLRKLNNWTQEELAVRMGYTDRSTIAKIESGKVDISQSKILEFARLFGVEAGELMGSDGIIDTEIEQTARNREFVELFANSDPVLQDSVVNILKAAQHKV